LLLRPDAGIVKASVSAQGGNGAIDGIKKHTNKLQGRRAMRTPMLLTFTLLASLFVFCSKKDNTVVGPGPDDNDNDNTQSTAFQLKKHTIFEQLPSSVITLFQVTDLDKKGVDFLTADRFQIYEQNVPINLVKANAFLLKRNDINYTIRTRIIIDNNAGSNLATLKKGAVEFIKKMDRQQQMAVYTLSDNLVKVADFTSNVNALVAVVDGITEGNAGMNLYGAILEVNREAQDEYTADSVQQNSVVIFLDSNDSAGAYPIDIIKYATIDRQIFTVGLGSSLNATELSQISVKSFYQSADETEFVQNAVKAQNTLMKYADSFYWLSYQSEKRGGSGHALKIMVSGNTNTGDGTEIIGTFDSVSFVDVTDGLYVNWSYFNPGGMNLVMVMANSQRSVQVLSMGGGKVPIFSYSISDPAVATVTPGAAGKFVLVAKGADGDSCKLTIKDTANNLTKEATVKIVSYHLGVVLYERWDDVTGTTVASLTSNANYPDNPTERRELTRWEIDVNFKDFYGTRIRGYIHPPQSRKYTFSISSDDTSELWLSTDDTPANKVRVCYVSSWTNSREWTKETNQKSAAIQLTAGKRYYIESLMKEGEGGDNLAVAWQIESGSLEVVSGDYLSLWTGN
jgi:hypothetical protein